MDREAFPSLWIGFKATSEEFKLCQNRLWALLRCSDRKEGDLRSLRESLLKIIPKGAADYRGHEMCTFDFCESSLVNFTGVKQRHETEQDRCKGDDRCKPIQGCFQANDLIMAARNRELTAWKLDGKSLVERPEPFMAISHVWSDGTGTGAWQQGQVNECLYRIFRDIAERFQCSGIWWDTICIPTEKAAKNKIINEMHRYYEDARVTLVHDCFLRGLKWVNAEIACFAIVMSPWFSRGWTALELAKSRKVKVLFRGDDIKDLDEDILQTSDGLPLEGVAPSLIRSLRNLSIDNVGDILAVLGSRYTSWLKDMAIISGQLVGSKTTFEHQQDIYQGTLKKIRNVSHGHLFHNSATMSKGFSWCPARLFDMPLVTPAKMPLRVGEDGCVSGLWRVCKLDESTEKDYVWNGMHPLLEARLKLALKPIDRDKHVLLVEPEAASISKGLLVKLMTTEEPFELHGQFIGAVHFPRTPRWLDKAEKLERWIRIGDTNAMSDIEGNAWDHVKQATSKPNDTRLKEESTEEPNPYERDSDTWTALHRATWRGDGETVEKLINRGADQLLQDRLGQQALHLAAERGDEKIVSLLLKGSDLNAQCKYDGQTVLHRAAWGGSVKVVTLLMGKSDPSVRDKHRCTAFDIADQMEHTSVAKLLRYGAGAGLESTNCLASLSRTVRNGYQAVEDLLASEGTDINATDEGGMTLLSWAAYFGDEKVVGLLLNKKANLNATDRYGQTPISWAVRQGHLAVVTLLNGNPDANAEDEAGMTLLSWAAYSGNEGIVKLLLKVKPDINATDKYGQTPLSWAADYGNVVVVGLLLGEDAKRKSNVDPSQNRLFLAAHCGSVAAMKLLLNGATYRVRNRDGLTPLHISAERGHVAVVRLLLDKGANTNDNVYDSLEMTSLHLAAKEGHNEVVKLLADRSANLERSSSNGQTPLSWAARNGHEKVMEEMIKQLRKVGKNLEYRDKFGMTPLHWAAREGRTAIVKLLLREGHRPEPRNIVGVTPLAAAIEKGSTPIVKLLLETSNNVHYWYIPYSGEWKWECWNRMEESSWEEIPWWMEMIWGKDIWKTGSYKDLLVSEDSARKAEDRQYEDGMVAVDHYDENDRGWWYRSDYVPKSRVRRTPLLRAMERRDMAVVDLLLKKGVHHKDEYRQFAQSLEEEEGFEEVVDLTKLAQSKVDAVLGSMI
ncbi:hypothetical protein GP486_004212 [Trichoglossum hirsutum]|uniref:Heterokaryon incompatibility domain-containing protein n=1 Tax=Trichoglossum hirsutum TaxID=265104 RepID=A0A9P8RPI3_9PEZI|nr:hypothetical protein GP486_004212 [Trichoglossum hirsutum]